MKSEFRTFSTLANITSNIFPKMGQLKGLSTIKMAMIVSMTSLLQLVVCMNVSFVTDSIEQLGEKSAQNQNNNKTSLVFKSPDTQQHVSDVRLLRNIESNKSFEVEYVGLPVVSQNTSEVPRENMDGTGNPVGDRTKQDFKTGENTKGLEWLHDVYNPHIWGPSPPGKLGAACGMDMKLYLAALRNSTVWAAKSKYTYNCPSISSSFKALKPMLN
jgi:hypothetical protein